MQPAPLQKNDTQNSYAYSTCQGFFVTGEQGPLKDAELERALEWGKRIRNS